MVLESPTSKEPTGAPKPFERQIEIVSKFLTILSGLILLAITALNKRAPSKCALQLLS